MLKQCGQLATIVRTPTAFSVSTFCSARVWNRNSLPIRRAGSPVQSSRGPRIANETPARASSSATDRLICLARSSNEPAQPTQYRTSGALPFTSGTPRPAAQSARVDCGCPHGFELFSRLRSMAPASTGKRDSPMTRARRRSTIVSMCSMSTGHSSTHAPHVVHAQTASSSTTPGTSACGSNASPAACAARIAGPSARAWSRRSMMSSFGDRGLPVFHAGQTLWHRPHSVHAPRSSSDFCVRPGSVSAPSDCSPASSAAMSIRSGSRAPCGRVDATHTFSALVAMCRCFEYGRYTRKPSTIARCTHTRIHIHARAPSGDIHVNRCEAAVDRGVHEVGDSATPAAIRAPL